MERSTAGIRDVMFDEIEKYLKGEKSADHLHALKAGFSTVLATVDKDIQAAKMIADARGGKNQPRSVADLNLNLLLTARRLEGT
jgi:hypothetical protein